jgi:hypothetical protein
LIETTRPRYVYLIHTRHYIQTVVAAAEQGPEHALHLINRGIGELGEIGEINRGLYGIMGILEHALYLGGVGTVVEGGLGAT